MLFVFLKFLVFFIEAWIEREQRQIKLEIIRGDSYYALRDELFIMLKVLIQDDFLSGDLHISNVLLYIHQCISGFLSGQLPHDSLCSCHGEHICHRHVPHYFHAQTTAYLDIMSDLEDAGFDDIFHISEVSNVFTDIIKNESSLLHDELWDNMKELCVLEIHKFREY